MRDSLVGYALGISNETLGVNLFGSPKELSDECRQRGMSVSVLVTHPDTGIEAAEVLKPSPGLGFSGGPHAETTIELLDCIREDDVERASSLVRRDPDALLAAQTTAAVPLLAAVACRSVRMTECLLHSGAKPDASGELGMTPLHWSAALGETDIVKLLLAAGADAQGLTWFYVTAGELAALNKHDATASLIAANQGLSAVAFSLDRVLERMTDSSIEIVH